MCAYVHIYTHKRSSIFFMYTHMDNITANLTTKTTEGLIPFLCYHYAIIFGNAIFGLPH